MQYSAVPRSTRRITREYPGAVQADVRWVWSGALGDKSVKVLTDRALTGVLTGYSPIVHSPAYSLGYSRGYSQGNSQV
jgi:hypothetical protein